MKLVPSRPVRRLLAGLTPIILASVALPLLAPTCGGFEPGVKSFSRGSLIIPMDVCYQCSTDGDNGTTPSACGTTYAAPTVTPGNGYADQPTYTCGQNTDQGDVVKAYGLVYQLIRAGVPVYWVVDPAKAALNGVDLKLTYSGGPPVQLYNWDTEGPGAAPTSSTSIQYLGGPFIVDGSDYAKALDVLKNNKATFGVDAPPKYAVNIHMANVAFTAPVKRTMAGGWTAGGTVPPKLALLDIGSSGAGAKNSEVVIRGYLIKAGLDFVGAGGTSAAGQHGQIYDRLTMADFLPDASGDWKTTNLYKNGYQILWVPHWAAPSSCSDCTTSPSTGSGTCPTSTSTCPCTTKYSATDISKCLKTIGSFYGSGKDVFAECAGLGSFEGVLDNPARTTTSVNATYGAGDATTHFQTVNTGTPATTGAWINKGVTTTATFQPGNFASPFLQIGDFVFRPYSGAIQNYQPTKYRDEATYPNDHVDRFVSETSDTNYDIFTIVPALATGHGTSVYMGGHSYSGCDGTFQTAGTRLVLNSLFNLGASCVASGVSCSTGYLGACAQGTMTCDTNGVQVCSPTVTPDQNPEICNGVDDNCNGLVDEGLADACYDADAATRGVGICHDGVRSCERKDDGTYAMGLCVGQQKPAAGEVCNGLDDDCDGQTDEGLYDVCYTGSTSTLKPDGTPMGICKKGHPTCSNGSWGRCEVCSEADAAKVCTAADLATVPLPSWCACQVLPLPMGEYCGADNSGNGLDDNCNGVIDEGCTCTDLATMDCYSGASGTIGQGMCRGGKQTCNSGVWGACSACSPADALAGCSTADQNLDPLPSRCTCQVVPGAPDCTKPDSAWTASELAAWLALPQRDSNCNGVKDYTEAACNVCPAIPKPCYEGPEVTKNVGLCKEGVYACTAGVFGACMQQILPALGELCDGKDNDCDGLTDEGADCGTGFTCANGLCVYDSCGPEVPCPGGYDCVASKCTTAPCGTSCDAAKQCCTVGGCGAAPYGACKAGLGCDLGTCTDPCDTIQCAPGSVCAGGICTGGACYASGCGTGQVCVNGGCAVDRCAGNTCPSGTFCRDGDCVQSCTWVSCPAGQRCGSDGFCVADPCAGVTCQSGYACGAGGGCLQDPCAGAVCGTGQMCVDGGCVDDPCATIDCPVGACWRGQCFPSSNPKGLATPPAPPEKGGCGCGGDAGSPWILLFGLLALPLARRRRAPPASGLLALGLVVGLSGLLAGCPKKEEVDLSGCTETCGEQRCVDVRTDAAHCGQCSVSCADGEICVDSSCGPASAVAPYVSALAPASAAKGTTVPVEVDLTGQRFQSGAKLRVIRPSGWTEVATTFTDAQHLKAQVNVSGDPTSTLYLRVVNPDKVVSNAPAFQIIPASPIVTKWSVTIEGVSSSTLAVPTGKVGILQATGTGLTSASLCHVKSVSYLDHALPTTPTATGIDCTLDTASVPPGSYQLWVMNEGTLKSTETSLLVTSATPTLTSLSPSSAKSSSFVDLTLYGGGFDPTSKVLIDGTEPLAGTTYLDPATLRVSQLNLAFNPVTSLPYTDGTHTIQVKNGTVTSNSLSFLVESNPPSVTGLSPQTAYQGQSPTVTFTGSNIPSNAVIKARKPDTTEAPLTTTVTGGTSASATLALTPTTSWPAGSYQLFLSFPTTSTTSGSFPFTVLSNGAVLSSATPAGKEQGSTGVTIALTGSNFFSGMKVYLRGGGLSLPGVDISPASVTSTTATTASFSLANFNAGLYQIVAVNTGAADSNTLAFSVTPGVPTLSTVSPASIPQSTQCATTAPPPTVVTLTGTNFAKPDASGNGGSQVVTWNTNLGIPVQVLPTSSVVVESATRIVVSVDTCQAIPSPAGTNPYTVQIWNPGGLTPPQKSNGDKTLYITP